MALPLVGGGSVEPDRRQELWSEQHQANLNPGSRVQVPAANIKSTNAGVGQQSLGRKPEPWERQDAVHLMVGGHFDRGLGLNLNYGSNGFGKPARRVVAQGSVDIDGKPVSASKKKPSPLIDPSLSGTEKVGMAHQMAAEFEEHGSDSASRLGRTIRRLLGV